MGNLAFTIVIPTYNEAGGIERLLRALGELFTSNNLDGEVIVVDDNSPDGTGAILDRLAAEFPPSNRNDSNGGITIRPLHRPGKLGLSSGVIQGWQIARPESRAFGAIDADFSHDIAILPKMVAAISSGSYGLAIGSRYVPGGGITNWPQKRIITSRIACMLGRPLTRVKDLTSGYFLVKREALDGIELDPIGFKIGLEVIAKARYGKAIEIPYVFTDRIVGESKLNQREIFNYLKQLRKLYTARLFGNRSNSAKAAASVETKNASGEAPSNTAAQKVHT
jgi:dolichol-phosphate mannosyltransferase